MSVFSLRTSAAPSSGLVHSDSLPCQVAPNSCQYWPIGRQRRGRSLERIDVAPEGDDVAVERIDVAVERVDVAPEGVDVAVERIDVAPEGADVAVERVDVAVEWVERAVKGVDVAIERRRRRLGAVDRLEDRLDDRIGRRRRGRVLGQGRSRSTEGCDRRAGQEQSCKTTSTISVPQIPSCWGQEWTAHSKKK